LWARALWYLERPLARVALVYLAVRAVLLVAAVLAAHQSYGGHLAGPFYSWDSHFYLELAANGYPRSVPLVDGRYNTFSAAGFSPMFPLLIRAVAAVGVPEVGAGIIVSVLSGGLATSMVYLLGRDIGGEDLGYCSALLFMVFPGLGVSWGLIYSESAGTAFIAGALLLMKRGHWVWAGVLGALATATSPAALPLVPAALVPAVQALRHHRRPTALLTPVIAVAGQGSFVLWEARRYHNLLFNYQLQHQAWGTSVDFGKALVFLLGHLWRAGYQGPGWLEWAGVVAVALGALCMFKAKLPGYVTAYCVVVVAELALTDEGLKPRLLTWAFPALIAVAAALKPRARNALVLLCMGLLPIVFLAYSTIGNTMVQP
jgi:hypothetical protein